MRFVILKNTIWGLLGEILARLSKLALVVLMARFLGAAEVGQFNYALAQAGLFVVLFDFGVMTIALREMSRKPDVDSTFRLFGCLKLLSTLTGIIAVTLSAVSWHVSAEERLLMAFLGLYLAINDLSTFVFTIYRARGEIWRETLWRSIFSALQLGVGVAALSQGLRVDGVVIALAGSAALCLGPLIHEVLKRLPASGTSVFETDRVLPALRQCLPIAGMVLVGSLIASLDILVLGSFVTMQELGGYSVVVKTTLGLLIMPMHYFQLATLPVLSAQLVDRPVSHVRQQWLQLFVTSTTAGALITLFVSNSASWLVPVLFGAEFAAAAPVLEVFSLVCFLFFLYTPLTQLLLLAHRQYQTLYVQFLALAINAVSLLLLIPPLGVFGAVLAGVITYGAMFSLYLLLVWKVAGFSRSDEGWWAIARVSIGLVGAISITYLGSELAWSSAFSIAVFLACAHRETHALAQPLYSKILSKSAFK